MTGWLARFADALPEGDVTRAGAQFPANPFIALREAEAATARGDDYASLSAVRRALAVTLPFPAWTQLAARLDRAGFPAAANLALDRAKRDAAARGIDPAVPVSRAALFAYGNPSGGLWMIVLSCIVYGMAFDFFNISGSLFVETQTVPSIRASACLLYTSPSPRD